MKTRLIAIATALSLTSIIFSQELEETVVTNALKTYQDAVNDPDQRIGALRGVTKQLIMARLRSEGLKIEEQQAQSVRTRVLERLRMDRETGAPTSGASGTSLVARSGVTEFISAAMESGTLERTTQGSVTTVRLNALGLLRLLNSKPAGCDVLLPYCPTPWANPLRGLSIASSFDASRTDQTGAPAPANVSALTSSILVKAKRTLSAVDVRYELYNRRDSRDEKMIKDWKSAISDLRTKAADEMDSLADALKSFPFAFGDLFAAFVRQMDEALGKLPANQREKALKKAVETYVTENSPHADDLVRYARSWKKFQERRSDLLAKALFTNSFTAEFTHIRPVDQPEYGSAKIIGSFPFNRQTIEQDGGTIVAPISQFTFNAGFNFYYENPAGVNVKKLRDFQIAGQLDHRLVGWTPLNRPQLSVAGYYQYLTDNLVLEFSSDATVPNTNITLPKPANQILKDTRGNVIIGQVKLTIPVGQSGVSIPIAVSASNRSELLAVKGTQVYGQFGLSFNFDSLLGALKSVAK